jgi:dephospho-CoA kinase
MLKVAITGNIGTGKTTVCKVFESLGIPVFYADAAAKRRYHDPAVIQVVKQLFGEDIFDEAGRLKNTELANIVFQDSIKLKQLNAIIHPLVLADFLKWAEQNNDRDYIIYESALLFESGFNEHFDKSILITAPAELATARVMLRDQVPAGDVEARRANQMPEDLKVKLADILIENNEKEALIPRIIKIHTQLTNKAE